MLRIYSRWWRPSEPAVDLVLMFICCCTQHDNIPHNHSPALGLARYVFFSPSIFNLSVQKRKSTSSTSRFEPKKENKQTIIHTFFFFHRVLTSYPLVNGIYYLAFCLCAFFSAYILVCLVWFVSCLPFVELTPKMAYVSGRGRRSGRRRLFFFFPAHLIGTESVDRDLCNKQRKEEQSLVQVTLG